MNGRTDMAMSISAFVKLFDKKKPKIKLTTSCKAEIFESEVNYRVFVGIRQRIIDTNVCPVGERCSRVRKF